MNPHKLTLVLVVFLLFSTISQAQRRRVPPGGRLAVVIDERLAAVRATPQLDGRLVRRLSRGRVVGVRSPRRTTEGIFVFVNISSRTYGWILREAIALPSDRNDEQRLLLLVKNSTEFERITRARILLDYFPRSSHRPSVLLLLGDAAESVAAQVSRDVERKLASSLQTQSYFMNHSALDRYNRLGVFFAFDSRSKRLHYNGATWREIIRRFPKSPEANVAQLRLGQTKSGP